jgi:hypothetical protein
MVRAILDGRKTMTRRVFKARNGGVWPNLNDIPGMLQILRENPYGQPGYRLWVRETWGAVTRAWDESGDMAEWVPDRPVTPVVELPFGNGYYTGHIIYAADGSYEWAGDDDGGGEARSAWHPSIHMPRKASRITLEITGVRVERLNDISAADAKAEGLAAITKDGRTVKYGIPDLDGLPGTDDQGWPWTQWDKDPRQAFKTLWKSINGESSWDANPWVWVVEFKRVQESA